MVWQNIHRKEIMISDPLIELIYPLYHHLLEKEFCMKKRLLNNVLINILTQKIEKFIQEVFWRVYWKGLVRR